MEKIKFSRSACLPLNLNGFSNFTLSGDNVGPLPEPLGPALPPPPLLPPPASATGYAGGGGYNYTYYYYYYHYYYYYYYYTCDYYGA